MVLGPTPYTGNVFATHHDEVAALGGAFVVLLLTLLMACVCLIRDQWCRISCCCGCGPSEPPRGTSPPMAEASNGFDEEIHQADEAAELDRGRGANSATGFWDIVGAVEDFVFCVPDGRTARGVRRQEDPSGDERDERDERVECGVDTERRTTRGKRVTIAPVKDDKPPKANGADDGAYDGAYDDADDDADDAEPPAPRRSALVKQTWRRGVRAGGRE